MSKSPLVSIIVPAYNVEKYIKTCLDSILRQTYKNIELIVVNDASPGDISDIVLELQKKHNNIVFVDLKENVGAFQARIKGMKKAKGEYITFIDGDDFVCIDYVEKLVKRAIETNADIVLGEMIKYGEKDKTKIIDNLAKSIKYDEIVQGEGAALAELLRKGNFFWELCGKLYSKAVINSAMKDLLKIDRHLIMGEDMLSNFHLLFYCNRLARTEFAFYYYLINEGSITAKTTDVKKKQKIISDLVFVFETAKSFMENKGVFKKYEKRYRYLRNMQAAKYHIDICDHFSGKNRIKLLKEVNKIMYDKQGFKQEVALRSIDNSSDINDLKSRLESMNSIKASSLKLLSNIKRKLKDIVN